MTKDKGIKGWSLKSIQISLKLTSIWREFLDAFVNTYHHPYQPDGFMNVICRFLNLPAK